MAETGIEWTDRTWNPVAGCSVASPGCKNCYAMTRVAPRLASNPATPQYHGTVEKTAKGKYVWTGRIGIADERKFYEPLRLKKPSRIFVNSTSDLFHPNVPEPVIDRVFAVMALAPQHTFQVLTKHPERMQGYCGNAIMTGRWRRAIRTVAPEREPSLVSDPLPNVWLGTSVENQEWAEKRIPHLLATPAAKRFISAEPLIGPVDLENIIAPSFWGDNPDGWTFNCLTEGDMYSLPCTDIDGKTTFEGGDGPYRENAIDWVIAGGESGPAARPMHPDWARQLRDQCQAANVPFFFKQWGEWLPWTQFNDTAIEDDPEQTQFETREWVFGKWENAGYPQWMDSVDGNIDDLQCSGLVGTKRAGRLLDGKLHHAFPCTQSCVSVIDSAAGQQPAPTGAPPQAAV